MVVCFFFLQGVNSLFESIHYTSVFQLFFTIYDLEFRLCFSYFFILVVKYPTKERKHDSRWESLVVRAGGHLITLHLHSGSREWTESEICLYHHKPYLQRLTSFRFHDLSTQHRKLGAEFKYMNLWRTFYIRTIIDGCLLGLGIITLGYLFEIFLA